MDILLRYTVKWEVYLNHLQNTKEIRTFLINSGGMDNKLSSPILIT